MAVIYPLLLPDSRRGTVMEQFGGLVPEGTEAAGKRGRGAGRRNAAARPLCGRAFGAAGAKAGAPRLSYTDRSRICTAHARCWKPPFLKETRGKEKGGLFGPVSFMRFTDAYQNCPECR